MRDTSQCDVYDESGPRRFYLYRGDDVTGASGTGRVAWGVRFPDGVAVMRWCVADKPRSTTVYDSVAEAEAIHGHDGKTCVVWIDYPADSWRRGALS